MHRSVLGSVYDAPMNSTSIPRFGRWALQSIRSVAAWRGSLGKDSGMLIARSGRWLMRSNATQPAADAGSGLKS